MKTFLFILMLLTIEAVTAQQNVKILVKSHADNAPVEGATIKQLQTKHVVITDSLGIAIIPVTDTVHKNFTAESLGFVTQHFTLPSFVQDGTLVIYLEPEKEHGALEAVIISTLRTNSRIENTPTPIEVLGADDMDEENGIKPGNISSLLGDIAGIQMQQVSASSGNTYARIQGLDGRYTQILKDGIPLYGGLSGSFGIMQIPPLDLKQIEIIKGSASTLYGGDAIGGIINLISKNPTNDQELSATINRTTLKETNINAYAAKRYNKFGYTLTATKTFQNAGDIDKDGLSDVPKVNSTVIHPKFIVYFSPKSTLTLNYTGTFDKRQGGDIRYFSSRQTGLYYVSSHMNRHAGDIKWQHHFSENSNLVIKFSNSSVHQNLATKYYDFTANQWIYYSEISYFHKYKSMDWVGGINFNGDVFNNRSINLPQLHNYRYNTTGLFLQNTWHATKNFIVEGGLRYDYHSTYHGFVLPRLALLYKLSKKFSARLNGGLGYKTPTLLNYINPETDLGILSVAHTLKPELSQGANADINFHSLLANGWDITINQSFFITNLTRPIYDSSSVETKIVLINATAALQTKGLHTYTRIAADPWEFYLGYVFTDISKKYDHINTALPVTPKHNLSAVILYEPSKKWRTGIESSFVAGQVNENYQPVKNYILLAAMFQYNMGKISFVFNGENLLDFRQNKYGLIYNGSIDNPVFHKLWAPIDGRVINFSVKWSL